jgi:hypothetical protein
MDFVFRNHWHPRLYHHSAYKSHILKWFPLGMNNGFGKPSRNSILPASMRRFRCSFRGAKWENRKDFFYALRELNETGRLQCQEAWSGTFGGGLSQSAFRQELLQSAFVLCPPGNYNPDSYRIYEALSSGGIPIIPEHWEFEPLGKHHPIPMIKAWIHLSELIESIEGSPGGVDAYQARVYGWWLDFIERLQTTVATMVG